MLICITAGCSTTGGSLTIFPNDHLLMHSARALSAAAPVAPATPRELSKTALEAYFIQPGDTLLLEIADLETDIRVPADQTVLPDGTIDLGKYGRPVVAGMTLEQIESVVLSAVHSVEQDSSIEPINVRLIVAESAQFYVLGEVNAPGAYPLIGRETVLDAIMTAGGLSDSASDCQIILSRPTPPDGCRIVLPICYDRIVQLGDTTTNYQIRPGDRIFVATRSLPEQLMFWETECEVCPDCIDGGCPTSVPPTISPFLPSQGEFHPSDFTPAEPLATPLPALGQRNRQRAVINK